MAKQKKPASGTDQPRMTSRIPEGLTYDYQTHLNRIRLRRAEEPARQTVPSKLGVEPHGSDPCAIGFCPNCGRTIVSAVHRSDRSLRMRCGLCDG